MYSFNGFQLATGLLESVKKIMPLSAAFSWAKGASTNPSHFSPESGEPFVLFGDVVCGRSRYDSRGGNGETLLDD